MQNIIHLISTDSRLNDRLRRNLTYFSILLFIGFAGFATISVKDYVSDTLSITLVEPEVINIVEEVSEESSDTVTIKSGDTLQAILNKQSLPGGDILKISRIAKEYQLVSNLKIGQQITFDYEIKISESADEDLTSQTRTLTKMILPIDKISSLEIIRDGDNFIAKNTSINFNKIITKSSAAINSSFMSALKSLGLSSVAL